MPAQPIEHLEQAEWRYTNMRTELKPTADGWDLHFYCCNTVQRFTNAGNPVRMIEVVNDHITKPCPASAGKINWQGSAVASGKDDRLTPYQRITILAITNPHGLSAEKLAMENFGCRLDQLCRPAASAMIDWLRKQV